jgi:hypothetical protein
VSEDQHGAGDAALGARGGEDQHGAGDAALGARVCTPRRGTRRAQPKENFPFVSCFFFAFPSHGAGSEGGATAVTKSQSLCDEITSKASSKARKTQHIRAGAHRGLSRNW